MAEPEKPVLPDDLNYGDISGPHDCAVLARASKEQCEARIKEIDEGTE
jgi:hypothetical protein